MTEQQQTLADIKTPLISVYGHRVGVMLSAEDKIHMERVEA